MILSEKVNKQKNGGGKGMKCHKEQNWEILCPKKTVNKEQLLRKR